MRAIQTDITVPIGNRSWLVLPNEFAKEQLFLVFSLVMVPSSLIILCCILYIDIVMVTSFSKTTDHGILST